MRSRISTIPGRQKCYETTWSTELLILTIFPGSYAEHEHAQSHQHNMPVEWVWCYETTWSAELLTIFPSLVPRPHLQKEEKGLVNLG